LMFSVALPVFASLMECAGLVVPTVLLANDSEAGVSVTTGAELLDVTVRLTLPEKPPAGVTVMVLVPPLPCLMLRLVGFADSVKLGPAAPASALMRPEPLGLPQPVTRS